MIACCHRRPERDRPSPFLVALCLFPFILLTGCVSIPASHVQPEATLESEREVAPPESRFVRLSIPVASATGSFPTWRTRSPGRPVLLLHAINGLTPALLHLALEMESWGYRVYLPSLYGDPIEGEPAYGFNKTVSMIKVLKQDGRWNPISTTDLGPIVDETAMIARWISRNEGGQRLIVMGNSLTGAFPLSLLDEPCVQVAVIAQPATPVPRMHEILTRSPRSVAERSSLSLDEVGWARLIRALRSDPGKRIIGFNYHDDPIGTIERLDQLHERLAKAGLASRFRAYVLSQETSDFAEGRSWVRGGYTLEKPRMLPPHSTFIEPENLTDRDWFRDRLRESLRRP